jgi:branched-chain amino acid transport system substrate-binding protein
MKKISVVVMVLLMFVVSFAGAQEVNLSSVFCMTGGAAAYGEMTYQGVKVAMELFPEILGMPVKMTVIDTKSDKVEAANGVRRAIENENAVAILGNIISGNSLAGGAVAEELKTVMVSPTSTSPIVTEGKKYMNRVCFTDAFQGQAAAKLLYNLGDRHVAVFVDVEQDYAVSLANYFKKTFESLGGTMFYEYYKSGDQDFSAQVLDAMSKNVDAFYMPGYYQEIALISLQAYQNGFYGDLATGDGAYADETVEIGGEAVEGLYLTAGYHADSPAFNENAEKFLSAYEEMFPGEKPSMFAGLGFDAYMVLRDAIERAGSLDKEKIADEIRKTKKFPGSTGFITITDEGNAEKSVVIVKIEDGKYVYDSVVNP